MLLSPHKTPVSDWFTSEHKTSFRTYRNAAGQVTRQVDDLDRESITFYDVAGLAEETKTRRPLVYIASLPRTDVSHSTTFQYNTASLVREQKQRALDGIGAIIESYGAGTSLTYDHLGRVKTSTQEIAAGQNATTSFGYDVYGHRTSLQDPELNTTSYAVDPLGRVTSETITVDATPLVRSYTYDSFGNVLEATDRNGRVLDYAYDNAGQLTDEWWDGQLRMEYAYTAAGELEENEPQKPLSRIGATTGRY